MREIDKHWFCFTYADSNVQASTYSGYEDKNVTLAMIEANKVNAGVSSGAVLTACIWLGYMTRAEFKGE